VTGVALTWEPSNVVMRRRNGKRGGLDKGNGFKLRGGGESGLWPVAFTRAIRRDIVARETTNRKQSPGEKMSVKKGTYNGSAKGPQRGKMPKQRMTGGIAQGSRIGGTTRRIGINIPRRMLKLQKHENLPEGRRRGDFGKSWHSKGL